MFLNRRWQRKDRLCVGPARIDRQTMTYVVLRLVIVSGVFLAIAIGARGLQAAPSRTLDLSVSQGRMLQLDRPAASVFVADPDIADLKVVTPNAVYVFGKKPGVTNLIALSANNELQAEVRLRVVVDSTPPNEAVGALQPQSNVDVSLFGKRLVARGNTGSVAEAIDVGEVANAYSPDGQTPYNRTTVAGSQQVNIRVRFAEISRNDLTVLGIDWNLAFRAGFFSLGTVNKGSGGFGSVNVDVLVQALQRNGIMTVLAEPNLTAVTGQEATFLAGGEIPIPVPGQNQALSISYKPFGVSLAFTPILLQEDRIALRVRPEVSTLSAAGAVQLRGLEIPALSVRRAETTVEVASGQTFAIAGLFQRNLAQSLEKIPMIGDLPVLGALFRSQSFRRDESELVILITPYIVSPVGDKRLATPLDRPRQALGQQAAARVVKGPSSGLIFK
ncbi:type II and III secretion system protein family protein [Chelatococcus daeguensis]|uniref:type II and III secretion system protein family protein n=1 Tax=Chelatococcus daeguensis TaxID=444444 RepID=UPI0007ABE560|nr:type II and III secretion system protein family protein [Chelatococcus daeguensis]KZE28274.1 type II and III secretion system protein RhcC2 [Chelatococcus daeguensis]MBM3084364.1 type II and III secretion system protein family protein [Chelatococcus daeguensis]